MTENPYLEVSPLNQTVDTSQFTLTVMSAYNLDGLNTLYPSEDDFTFTATGTDGSTRTVEVLSSTNLTALERLVIYLPPSLPPSLSLLPSSLLPFHSVFLQDIFSQY